MKKVTFIDSTQKEIKPRLRVAAYCRVSTDSDAQLESLETQKSNYEQYITSRDDWTFAGLYYEEGITGLILLSQNPSAVFRGTPPTVLNL